jgi:hypothetical protein
MGRGKDGIVVKRERTPPFEPATRVGKEKGKKRGKKKGAVNKKDSSLFLLPRGGRGQEPLTPPWRTCEGNSKSCAG